MTMSFVQAKADLIREPQIVVGLQVDAGSVIPDGFTPVKPSVLTVAHSLLESRKGHRLYTCAVFPANTGFDTLTETFETASDAAWQGADQLACVKSKPDRHKMALQVALAACRTFASMPSFELIVDLFGETPQLHITPAAQDPQNSTPISVVFCPQRRVCCSVVDCYNVVKMADDEPPATWMSVNIRSELEMLVHENASYTSGSKFTMTIVRRMLHVDATTDYSCASEADIEL